MPLFKKNTNNLKKYDLALTGNGYRVRLNFKRLGKRLDYAQLVLDTQIWQDVQRYMPVSTSMLVNETNTLNASVLGSGKVYVYPPNNAYGHYQYQGIVYKDPVYNFAGLFDPQTGKWWSRRGVKKVPSTQLLKYSQPNAIRQWGRYAIEHHGNEWYDLVKKAMKK